MAAAAVPIGASLLAPELAGAAAPMLAGTMFEGAAPWLAGAAMGGIGGLLTGQNPLQGALLGGIGGGLADKFMPNGLGGLFDGGATSAPGALSSAAAAAAPDAANSATLNAGSMAGMAPQSAGAASSGLFGNVGKLLPYAGLAAGATLLDSATAPKTVGPPMQSHPSNPGQVAPLNRTEQNVDPNSYYAPSTVAARSYYAPYPMQPQFMANGGKVRGYVNGGSSSASSSNIPIRSSSMGGKLINSGIKHPSAYPIKGRNTGTFRYYADGGMINGAGDGQSDSIPAKLSDGEFVMSAPAVSALGNGSNDAGAAKLDTMQKNIIKKHYKGGKPHKAMGLGSYVH